MSDDLAIRIGGASPGVGWSPLLRFEFADSEQSEKGPESVSLAMAPFGDRGSECWWVRAETFDGIDGEVRFVRSNSVVMARVQCALTADVAAVTAAAYAALLGWLERAEVSAIYRIWNYFPGITRGEGDSERYRQFSVGRMQAFRHSTLLRGRPFPAATAIGSQSGSMHIIALAGYQPADFRENPRQTSAWEYPRKYGPQSPSFARACALPGENGQQRILVSGTASVLGHQTVHPGSWERQLDEAIRNVQALTGASSRATAMRLYLGRDVPGEAATQQLSKAYPEAPLVALRGDVCRDDLLVEIEGVWDE